MSVNEEVKDLKTVKNFKFPAEIKILFEHFGNDSHWKILELLIQSNNKMSYTDLLKKTSQSEDIAKGTFNYHLDLLEQGGWLRNWSEKGSSLTEREVSNYEISKFAMKVIAGTLSAMNRRHYAIDPHREVKMLILRDLPEMLELPSDDVIASGGGNVFSAVLSNQGFSRIPPIEIVTSGKKPELQNSSS